MKHDGEKTHFQPKPKRRNRKNKNETMNMRYAPFDAAARRILSWKRLFLRPSFWVEIRTVLVLVLVLEELVLVELLLLLLELLLLLLLELLLLSLLLLLEPELLRPLPSLVLLRRCSAPSLLLLSLFYIISLSITVPQHTSSVVCFAFTQRMKKATHFFCFLGNEGVVVRFRPHMNS
jgi:hypothetical protein